METTLKFDRVILTKELNEKFREVGKVFEIANLLDKGFLLRDSKTRVALGVVSFEDFEKCFTKEEMAKGWTPWTPIVTDYEDNLMVFYRVNGKRRIQVKTSNGYIGESCCNKKFGDEFNLYFGLKLAFLRCIKNMFLGRINYYNKEINIYENEVRDLEDKIKQLINK